MWACDLTVDEWRLCRVSEAYVNDYLGDLVEVLVASQRIESTYHHPYWVVEGRDLDARPKPDHVAAAEVQNAIVPGRWVDAGDLRVGDVLLLRDGRHSRVDEVLVRQVEQPIYNFQVQGLHNYAVGPHCVLVHNNSFAEEGLTAYSEVLNGYSILGQQGRIGDTFVKRIVFLAKVGPGTGRGLLNTIEAQAAAAGARYVQIIGHQVGPRLLSSGIAGKLGWVKTGNNQVISLLKEIM